MPLANIIYSNASHYKGSLLQKLEDSWIHPGHFPAFGNLAYWLFYDFRIILEISRKYWTIVLVMQLKRN